MKWKDRIKQIPVTVFSLTATDTPSLMKGRVRIFYRGKNRNGSIINESVAEQLVDTLAYIPIKGNYSVEANDFMGHDGPAGERIYGLVPSKADRNFAWEAHKDKDGIIREYACADVFIWTMYKEASDVLNKPQSMELYPESIEGDWIEENGQYYFEFSKASFLGLQVLGDTVEPCFEDAAFYDRRGEIEEEMMSAYAYYSIFKELCKNDSKGGKMDIFNQILKEQKGERPVEKEVVEETPIAEDQSAKDSEDNKENDGSAIAGEETLKEIETEEPVSEQKEAEKVIANDETAESKVEPSVQEEPLIETKTENEGLEESNETDFAAQIKENNLKIVELQGEISTYKRNIEEYETTISSLQKELLSLQEFKKTIDTEEKMTILNSYLGRLSSADIADFKARLDEFTATELEKELAYVFMKNYSNNFSAPVNRILVPNEDSAHDKGIVNVLDKYKNEEE